MGMDEVRRFPGQLDCRVWWFKLNFIGGLRQPGVDSAQRDLHVEPSDGVGGLIGLSRLLAWDTAMPCDDSWSFGYPTDQSITVAAMIGADPGTRDGSVKGERQSSVAHGCIKAAVSHVHVSQQHRDYETILVRSRDTKAIPKFHPRVGLEH